MVKANGQVLVRSSFVTIKINMADPARKDHQDFDAEVERESEPWSISEVIQKNEFLYPAGVGLAVVVLLLLTDSPYAWVATFSYFMLGLPGLTIYLRGRARAPVDQSWRHEPMETEGDRATVEKLRSLLATPKFPHPEEVERALGQFDQAVAMNQAVLLRLRSFDSPDRLNAQQIYTGIMARLKNCAHHCSQLTAIDSGYVMRRIQALNSKSQMNEYDQVELQSLQSKLSAREQILHDLIDALRANERALKDLARLAQSPP